MHGNVQVRFGGGQREKRVRPLALCLPYWLAPTMIRVARLLIEKFDRKVRVLLVDPDRVKAKNCYRQNFAEFEIGLNKAECLACRYGLAWGVEVLALPHLFEHEGFEKIQAGRGATYYNLTVLTGCVDNATARREIAAWARAAGYGHSRWWLDCGNSRRSGQVLLGGFTNKDSGKAAFPIPGYCVRLPLPSQQHPDLLIPDSAEPEEDETALSCADLAVRGEQGLAVNQMVAAIAGDYLMQMLVYGNLNRFQTFFDQGSGVMRSTYITPEGLETYGLTAREPQPVEAAGDEEEEGGDDEEE
jgi:PRTRC genetic system ThiF family protein